MSRWTRTSLRTFAFYWNGDFLLIVMEIYFCTYVPVLTLEHVGSIVKLLSFICLW